jgi:hypothetical protein
VLVVTGTGRSDDEPLLTFSPALHLHCMHVWTTNEAMDNMVFLQRWLQKFPQYRGRDLYIAGESYAGRITSQCSCRRLALSRLWSRFLCCFDHEKNVLRLALFRSRPERNAGHYIPQLAEAMVEFNKKDRIFNLRGVAVSLKLFSASLRVFASGLI